jgi:molecular chaperone GrpE
VLDMSDLLMPEPLPPGLDAALLTEADEGDLHEMAAAVTALTQEVRLQGRAFKQVAEAVSPVTDRVDALLSRCDGLEERGREADRRLDDAGRRRAQGPLLDVLLDVRDRLLLGRDTARAAMARPRPWWLRFGPADPGPAEALMQGYTLALERLEATLEELGVREIESAGEAFDPQRMRAVAVEETDGAAHGTVLEVVRPGYVWRGEVYRNAEVKVARPKPQKGRS